jgi:hypothetical protein
MGEKDFCFKHDKIVSSAFSGCEDFNPSLKDDLKKRFIMEKTEESTAGAKGEGKLGLAVETASGYEEFIGSKKSEVEGKLFLDIEEKGETPSKTSNGFDQGQKLFLAIIGGGLLVLIIVLFAAGVF